MAHKDHKVYLATLECQVFKDQLVHLVYLENLVHREQEVLLDL